MSLTFGSPKKATSRRQERPLPTKQLIIDVCDGKSIPGGQGLIASTHHGLAEVSLGDVYPFLDFDEAIAFAASSWKSRDNDPSFRVGVSSQDIYDLFTQVYEIGFPWLNKHKQVSEKLQDKHRRLNPFEGRDLQDRLRAVPKDVVEALVGKLQRRTKEYVFGCNYGRAKRARGGENYGLSIMNFQPVYPRKGKIIPAFASEIGRQFKRYPKNVASI